MICYLIFKIIKMPFIVEILWWNGQDLKYDTLFLIRSNKALCDYWMGGTLQMTFGVDEKPWIWQPCLELRLIFRVKLVLSYCYFNFNSPKFTMRCLHTQYEWDIIGCFEHWTINNSKNNWFYRLIPIISRYIGACLKGNSLISYNLPVEFFLCIL